jgi:hypothetical protein
VFVYNPSVFVILHYMREHNGFIKEMIREEAMATCGIQHHNRGKLDANLRRKLDLQKLCEKFPTWSRGY